MKAWHINKRGSLEQLTWSDVSEKNGGGIRVRVLGAALNPADQKILTGKDGAKFLHSGRVPIQLGYDFSGVTDSGEEVYGFLPYSSSNQQGAFAEELYAQADEIATKPKNISHAEAAAIATSALTALQALRKAQIKTGDEVLVNGASGGVGSMAVQIAKILGAKRVTATCSGDKIAFVQSLGADEVVDYRTVRLKDLAGRFDVILDAASNSSFAECQGILRSDGSYVTLLPSAALLFGFLQSLFTSKRVRIIVVKSTKSDLAQVATWVEAGQLKPMVEREFSLSALPAAMELMLSGKAKGKITVSAQADQ